MWHCRSLRTLFIVLWNVAVSTSFVTRKCRRLTYLPTFFHHHGGAQRTSAYNYDHAPFKSVLQTSHLHLYSNTPTDTESLMSRPEEENWYNSHISSIKAYNLAGVVNQGEDKVIHIPFGNCPNLVAVTGETGSGKSLLIAKLADLVTGGKATASLLPTSNSNNVAIIEMEISLSQPHLSHVQKSLQTIGLDPLLLFQSNPAAATLKLRRVLSIAGPSQKGGNARLRSVCEINGTPVPNKDLTTVASPLIAIIDASAAAVALAKPNARIAVIDTGVPASILTEARRTQKEYRECREQREKLQNDLANRALPPSIVDDDEQDLLLLQHWVTELDVFRDKMVTFCDSMGQLPKSHDSFGKAISALASVTWPDNAGTEVFSSLMYINILEFRDALKSLDMQVTSARLASEVLGSLSSSESAITALSLARNHLFDATANEVPNGRLSQSAEITHETINTIEEILTDCVKSLEDERKGLLGMLESIRERVMITVDDIDAIIVDWNAFARKHGMSPYTLPACHEALQSELYGNVEARILLPKALACEAAAQNAFEMACVALSKERKKVGILLSASVTKRMPSLGLEGSKFEVQTRSDSGRCVHPSCFAASSPVGIDLVDFLLIHEVDGDTEDHKPRGGNIDVVASSGEKARLLLAIECELPGSIGASCNIARENEYVSMENNFPPVAVLYDEIDAHVGGRAAVAMGRMLADQSRNGIHSKARGQIISITHSPSLAAIADIHLVIQKQSNMNGEQSVSVTATMVEGIARRKELARMASGDLAPDEAEAFADALLRDGVKRRIGG